MNLKIGLLIGIINLLFCTTLLSQVTCLPDSVVKKIVNELIEKDHLQYTSIVQDSIIAVQRSTINVQKKEINTYSAIEDHYKVMISSLEQRLKIKDSQLTDCKKESKQGKLKAFLGGTIVGGVITVIIILL